MHGDPNYMSDFRNFLVHLVPAQKARASESAELVGKNCLSNFQETMVPKKM